MKNRKVNKMILNYKLRIEPWQGAAANQSIKIHVPITFGLDRKGTASIIQQECFTRLKIETFT